MLEKWENFGRELLIKPNISPDERAEIEAILKLVQVSNVNRLKNPSETEDFFTPADYPNLHIDDLNFPTFVRNTLARGCYFDTKNLFEASNQELLSLKRMGHPSLKIVRTKLYQLLSGEIPVERRSGLRNLEELATTVNQSAGKNLEDEIKLSDLDLLINPFRRGIKLIPDNLRDWEKLRHNLEEQEKSMLCTLIDRYLKTHLNTVGSLRVVEINSTTLNRPLKNFAITAFQQSKTDQLETNN